MELRAPDKMMALGVDGSHPARTAFEGGGRAPDFVEEAVLRSTQERGAGTKQTTNAHCGVRQYLGYAPLSRRMAGMVGHRLVGEALRDGQWEALPRIGQKRIRNEVLGAELRVRQRGPGGGLRELSFFDSIAGEDLRTLEESERQNACPSE